MKIGNLEVYGVIYKIENLVNGKIYIGQTADKRGFDGRYRRKGKGIERVYNYYCSCKERDESYNSYLFRSIKKYGFNSFKITKELDYAFSLNELNIKEECWIKYYNSTNSKHGYNNQLGGDNHITNKETRDKISKARMGKYRGDKAPSARKVICLNTKQIFNTYKEASEQYNIEHSSIGHCCRGRYKSSGVNKITNEKLVWMYYEDYLKLNEEEVNYKIKNANIINIGENHCNSKMIICLNNNMKFKCMKEAEDYYKIKGIYKCCNNERNYCGKINNILLVWSYYSDYLHMSKKDIEDKISKANNGEVSKKVICINTYKIFDIAKEGATFYKCSYTGLIKCCKGKAKSCGKLPNGTPLRWMYYDEYIKQNQLFIHNENLGQAV